MRDTSPYTVYVSSRFGSLPETWVSSSFSWLVISIPTPDWWNSVMGRAGWSGCSLTVVHQLHLHKDHNCSLWQLGPWCQLYRAKYYLHETLLSQCIWEVFLEEISIRIRGQPEPDPWNPPTKLSSHLHTCNLARACSYMCITQNDDDDDNNNTSSSKVK